MQTVSEILPGTNPTVYDVPEFRDLSSPACRAELRVHRLYLQEWVTSEGERVAIVPEGRDAAGKGKLSAGITHYLNPRTARIVAQGTSTPQAMRNWLGHHYKVIPEKGEMVVLGRSRYSRPMIQMAMGYCTMRQYHYFINRVNEWEQSLADEGVSGRIPDKNIPAGLPGSPGSSCGSPANCNTGNTPPTTVWPPSAGGCSPTSGSGCSR